MLIFVYTLFLVVVFFIFFGRTASIVLKTNIERRRITFTAPVAFFSSVLYIKMHPYNTRTRTCVWWWVYVCLDPIEYTNTNAHTQTRDLHVMLWASSIITSHTKEWRDNAFKWHFFLQKKNIIHQHNSNTNECVCVCANIQHTKTRALTRNPLCRCIQPHSSHSREKKERKKNAHTLSATLRVPHRKTAEWTTAAAWWLRAHNEANEVHKNKCVCKICHIICLESWCFAFLFVCYGAAWLFFLAGHRFYIFFFQWLWMFEWKKRYHTHRQQNTHATTHI